MSEPTERRNSNPIDPPTCYVCDFPGSPPYPCSQCEAPDRRADPTDVVREIAVIAEEYALLSGKVDDKFYALRDIALRLAKRLESFRDIEQREMILLKENVRLKAEVERLQRGLNNCHDCQCECHSYD